MSRSFPFLLQSSFIQSTYFPKKFAIDTTHSRKLVPAKISTPKVANDYRLDA